MQESLVQTLAEYINEEILHQPDKILSNEDALLSSGLIDSFHVVDLAMFIEDTFGVILDDTELNKETFDTLAELAALIESRKAV